MNSRTDPGVVVVLVCNLKREDEACQNFNSNPWCNIPGVTAKVLDVYLYYFLSI